MRSNVFYILEKMKTRVLVVIGILISISFQAQESEKKSDDFKQAEQLLESALKNKSDRSEMKFKLISKKENAINYAEIILFELYGKENIEAQKPYKINLIDDYWVISGTLPKEIKGGFFEIIFDSWNGEVLILQHGK